ncbi:MAG: amidophosphoribosyltransferase [Chitinophagales bacterium]|nr:amidophosphoribosyltransferase [Chitinophagales bacterium]MDW8418231.1 amidophosphoribosyltransferase [Chitinophagales bacterium]
MSDAIHHECGIALIRLLKPLAHYTEKYHTASYALQKLYLLMEKQHNRGQDGAGVAVIKLDPLPGSHFINRVRSINPQPITDIFSQIFSHFTRERKSFSNPAAEAEWHKRYNPFAGELLLGHLRYGTYGRNTDSYCHPFIRENNWMTRNLVLAGNFNMTNVDDQFNLLIELGQHPRERSDTITVMEKIGHFLDDEVQNIFDKYKNQKYSNKEITDFIARELSVSRILRRSAKDFDGGYAMAGMFGHGDAFVLRDPNGIRPAYYYHDEEIVVVASERPAIQTTFNVPYEKIEEVKPGHALVIKKDGRVKQDLVREPGEKRSCSFERIYFSRGTDKEIYEERKKLGYYLTEQVLKAIQYDFENTVFSFIPNTAEVAFYGLMKGLEDYLNQYKKQQLLQIKNLEEETIERILNLRIRWEKIAVKDVKARTFITDDRSRDEMVSHVYDITYGSIRPGQDTLVVIDDSIVRGTTLQKSILANLAKLNPRKIVVVSSAPQIRYPDCYGIDMSRMYDFVAFRALVELLRERGKWQMLHEVYDLCIADMEKPAEEVTNHVKKLYDLFTDDEISAKISEIVKPHNLFTEVQVIFQTIENLHRACPNHTGDWYFTGNYPTPGGNKVANRAFINFIEGKNERGY